MQTKELSFSSKIKFLVVAGDRRTSWIISEACNCSYCTIPTHTGPDTSLGGVSNRRKNRLASYDNLSLMRGQLVRNSDRGLCKGSLKQIRTSDTPPGKMLDLKTSATANCKSLLCQPRRRGIMIRINEVYYEF